MIRRILALILRRRPVAEPLCDADKPKMSSLTRARLFAASNAFH